MSAARPIQLGLLAAVVLLAGAAAGYFIANLRMHPAAEVAVNQASGPSASPPSTPKTERKVLYWYDPMKPDQHFDRPGKSPYMEMELVAKYADEDQSGGVRIDPELTQNLGVRLATVERQRIGSSLTAAASVVFNDRDVAVVQARAGGFVERVYARAVGDVIGAGAPIADVLVTEWAGAQEEYLAVRSTGDQALSAAARQRLLLLGMSQPQIEAIEQSGKARPVMTIAAPIGGAIQELGVREGMSVMPGSTLARINGLRTVWLEAAVPESQAAILAVGRATEASFAAYPGEVFKGKIAAVLPQANAETRTLRVRLEFPNPGLRIRPGMFAQVRIDGPAHDALVVPSDAVVRTGKRALAFVSSKPGVYHPVKIEIGPEADGKVVVLGGLEAGQKVAVSGQFLIDSEASLQGVVQRASADEGGAAAARADALYEAQGEVTEIDGGEITLAHGAVPALQWPPMTMSFALAKPELAKGVKPGDQVRFRFRETDDGYAVESIEKTGGAK